MSVKDKIKLWIKSPFFWLVFAIVMTGLAILLVSLLSSNDPKCEGDKVPGCGGGCVPTCGQDQIWNCDKNKCECQRGLSPCGDTPCCRMCATGKDGKKYCCPKSQICPVDPKNPSGAQKCCDSGEICTDNVCTNVCGLNSDGSAMICKSPNTQCLRTVFTTDDQKNKFITDFTKLQKEKGITFNVDGMVGHACVPPKSECDFSTNQDNFPSDVPDNIHLYVNNSELVGDNVDDMGFCYTPAGKTANCSKLDKKTCASKTDCAWYNTLDPASIEDVSAMAAEMQKITGNYGYYCNPDGGSYDHFASKKSNNCSVIDCWKQFSNDDTSSAINFNYDTNICTIRIDGSEDKFPACTDSTKNKCPDNMSDTTKVCQNGAVIDKPNPKYKCIIGSNKFPVCAESTDPDASPDKSCPGDKGCVCPTGWTWYRGNGPDYTDQGCYKDAFENLGQHPADCTSYLLGCSGSCTPKSNDICGPGWTPIGDGKCSIGSSACTVYCKQTVVPQDTFYCDRSTLTWKKCTDTDCTESADVRYNGTQPKGGCYNDIDGPDRYCD